MAAAQPARGASALDEAELRRYLPEGLDPPAQIPPAVFAQALRSYAEQQRIDMQVLAAQVGIARRTLYRKVRDRNSLLAELYWYTSRLLFVEGLERSRALTGAARLLAVYAHFLHMARESVELRKQLRDEPDNTLALLTTKQGNVHGRVVQFIRNFLEVEQAAGHFRTDLPLDALAFAIVRMGESFLYAEVLTGESADYRFSVEMIGRLLRPDQIREAR